MPVNPVTILTAAAIVAVSAAAIAQESVEVQPTRPVDDAVVQARPLFHLTYTGLDDDDRLRKARFRITLDSQTGDGVSFSFDQRKKRNGCLPPGQAKGNGFSSKVFTRETYNPIKNR